MQPKSDPNFFGPHPPNAEQHAVAPFDGSLGAKMAQVAPKPPRLKGL